MVYRRLAEVVRHADRMLFTIVAPLELTDEESEIFKRAQTCHICEKQFSITEARLRHHCDRTGRFLGAVHPSCNLHYRQPRLIPVIFHNLSGYI